MEENEKTKLIDNKTLLRDYINTKKELSAYECFLKGNSILIDLPESTGVQISQYKIQILLNKSRIERCSKFLEDLISLIKLRSLEIPVVEVE